MKKLIVLLVLLLCVPVQATITTWVWGDREAVGARIGYDVTKNNEAGVSVLYWPDEDGPQVLGLYGVHHFANIVEFRNPLILEFLPETIIGSAYMGGKVDVNIDIGETSVSPVAGLIFEDTLFLEYQFDSFQGASTGTSRVLFGLRIKF